jgi:hypothetical protein
MCQENFGLECRNYTHQSIQQPFTQIRLIPDKTHTSTLHGHHQCQCLYLHWSNNCIKYYYVLVSVKNVHKIKMKGTVIWMIKKCHECTTYPLKYHISMNTILLVC